LVPAYLPSASLRSPANDRLGWLNWNVLPNIVNLRVGGKVRFIKIQPKLMNFRWRQDSFKRDGKVVRRVSNADEQFTDAVDPFYSHLYMNRVTHVPLLINRDGKRSEWECVR
jgi:hypothetical protein